MRDLTFTELDQQAAEQLPARELMGAGGGRAPGGWTNGSYNGNTAQLGVLNVMPLSTAEYEKAASDALGVPVKIGSARLATLTGIEVKLEGVTVGGAKLESIDWGRADLAGLDVVVITTAHDTYDWAAIVRDAPLVIDTRNATGPLPAAPNLVRL